MEKSVLNQPIVMCTFLSFYALSGNIFWQVKMGTHILENNSISQFLGSGLFKMDPGSSQWEKPDPEYENNFPPYKSTNFFSEKLNFSYYGIHELIKLIKTI